MRQPKPGFRGQHDIVACRIYHLKCSEVCRECGEGLEPDGGEDVSCGNLRTNWCDKLARHFEQVQINIPLFLLRCQTANYRVDVIFSI